MFNLKIMKGVYFVQIIYQDVNRNYSNKKKMQISLNRLKNKNVP